MNKVTVYKGLMKYFTLIYWKLQVNFISNSGRKLEIIQTATLEIDDDSELGRLLSDSNKKFIEEVSHD